MRYYTIYYTDNYMLDKLSLEVLLNFVSEKFDISIEDLKGKSRKGEIVKARFVFYKLSTSYSVANLSEIGRIVNRTHATVISGLKKMANEKELQCRYSIANTALAAKYISLAT